MALIACPSARRSTSPRWMKIPPSGPNDEPEQPVLLIFLSCPTDDIFAAHDAENQRRIKVAEMIRGQDVCALLWEILLVNYSTPGDEHENKVERAVGKSDWT